MRVLIKFIFRIYIFVNIQKILYAVHLLLLSFLKPKKWLEIILEEYNIKNIRFEFGTSTVQDVLKKYGKEQSYVNVEKTVEESILEDFPGIEGFL